MSEKGKFQVLFQPAMTTGKKIHGGRLVNQEYPQLVSVKGNLGKKNRSFQQIAKGPSDPLNASATKFLLMDMIRTDMPV